MQNVLYVFGGEKASGAEIVIDRLIRKNLNQVQAHLFIAPGDYANRLLKEELYPITVSKHLKKLNRSSTSSLNFLFTALQNYLFLSLKVLRYARINKVTAIHANTVVPASYLIPAVLLSKVFFPRIKWLWSDHDLNYFSKQDNLFAGLNLKFYHTTFVVSEAVKNKYRKSKHINKVHVLYNGLDIEKFKPEPSVRHNAQAIYEITNNTVIFGIAGMLSPRKGQLMLLNVLLERATKFNIYLLIAGNIAAEDKTYAEEVIKLANAYPKVVKYIGPVTDMVSFYNSCDIIISNSNIKGSEPLGTTIYEAMACGKIVIASDTGGTKEIIDNLKDGLLFVPEDNKDLSNTIEFCINNIENFKGLQGMARNKVVNKFNINTMAANYNKILNG